MIDYFTSFTFTDGVVFPNTRSINASGPSAVDGTEFVKLMIDDLWGRTQALMDYAGLTPDSVTESPANSQHIESIQKGFAVGPGIGVTWWKNSDPGVTGDRVLLLNGQGILIASFDALVTACYVGDGNNATASAFFKADDAAGTIRNTAGIWFILPDLRGFALRGLDLGGGVDPDGASRDVGSVQLDAFQEHIHYSGVGAAGGGSSIYGGTANDVPGLAANRVDETTAAVTTQAFTSIAKDDTVIDTPRTAIESRMVNIATRFGITF